MSIRFYILPIIWAIIIFIIIAIPGGYIPKTHGFWELLSPDKLVHLAMFTPFAYLLARGIYKNTKQLKSSLIIAFFLGIIYGSLTEIMQYYVIIGRNGNVFDVIADIIGVVLGLILFRLIGK